VPEISKGARIGYQNTQNGPLFAYPYIGQGPVTEPREGKQQHNTLYPFSVQGRLHNILYVAKSTRPFILVNTRPPHNMPYTAKAKTQQFSRRKPNLIKKADQLARLCHADVALIIRRNGRYYSYCFRDSKQAEKIWQRARKDAAKMPFLYIRCLSTGHLEKHLIVALKACERDRR